MGRETLLAQFGGKLTFAETNTEAVSVAVASTREELLQQVALAALPPPKHRARRMLNTSNHSQPLSPIADLPHTVG